MQGLFSNQAADRVEHDIDAMPIRRLLHGFDPSFLGVVHDHIRPVRASQLPLARGAGGRDDTRSPRLADLHRGQADPADVMA